VAWKTVVEPSATSAWTVCLCEWVDIVQNFTFVGSGHDALIVRSVAWGGMLMSALYVTYASVWVNCVLSGSAYAFTWMCAASGWSLAFK
jgi:hypothetical protein